MLEETRRLRLEIGRANESLMKLAIAPGESLRKVAEDLQKSADMQRIFYDNYQTHIDQLIKRIEQPIVAQKKLVETLKHVTDPCIPSLRKISSLAKDIARSVEPYKGIYASTSAWEKSLITRMEALKTPWVFPDRFEQLMAGFARLSRLSDATHTTEPYSPSVAELVSDELGAGIGIEIRSGENADERDSSAVRAGFNPDLIAFPPNAYDEVVLVAGFVFCFTKTRAPQAIESGDGDAAFHSIYWRIFTELEQGLRHVVEKSLTQLDGINWIRRRVPEPMRKRWKERQEEDRSFGRPVYAPIQYADFMDLAHIVGQSNNWDEAFKPIFRDREDFMMSLRRLHPVRKAIAHSRPLGRSDVLTLVAEATRIFHVLGIRVWN